jgi:hypothetical protein
LFLRYGSHETVSQECASFQRVSKIAESNRKGAPRRATINLGAQPHGAEFLRFHAYRDRDEGETPIMDHGDIATGEILPQQDGAPTGSAQAVRRAGCPGAMMQQHCGHGLQSWPQQFIRLVGGHRHPAPVQSAPVRN